MKNHHSNIDVERFQKMECDKFEREIFTKLHKCDLNVFYVISKFKFDQGKFITALKKRKILFRDLEFSEDKLSFRIITQRDMTIDESSDKTLEFARNMYLVNQIHDQLELDIKANPQIQSALKENRKSYIKK